MRSIFFTLLFCLPFHLVSAQCYEGHNVFLTGGETTVSFCEGQASEDLLVRSDVRGFPKAYVLTRNSGEILSVSNSPRISLGNLRQGSYRIYAMVYAGRILETVGENISNARMTSFCWTFSDNYISVNIASGEEIEIEFANGFDELYWCSTGADSVPVVISTFADNSVLVLVDDDGKIVEISEKSFIGAGSGLSGRYEIWGFSYSGNIIANAGDPYDPSKIVDGCFSISTPLIIIIESADGGRISFHSGDTSLLVCPGSPSLTVDLSVSGNSVLPYYFFLVDESDTIVALGTTPTVDLSPLPERDYNVFGLSSASVPVLGPGDVFDFQLAVAGDCYDWSENQLKLRYQQIQAGNISFESFSDSTIFFCPVELPDSISVLNAGADSTSYAYVLSGPSGEVYQISFDGVFTGIPDSGIWVVTGIAYTDTFLLEVGSNFLLDDASNACFNLSENQLFLIVDLSEAGSVFWNFPDDSVSVCTGPGLSSQFVLDNNSSSVFPYLFILLDSAEVIVDIFTTDSIEVGDIPEGWYSIVGVSTSRPDLFGTGQNIDSIGTACFELSENALFVKVRGLRATDVFLSGGEKELRICGFANQLNNIRIFRNIYSPFHEVVLTDEDGFPLRIAGIDSLDIGNLTPGQYFIYGIGALDSINIAFGESVFSAALSDDCFALSLEPVSVVIGNPAGGNISLGGAASNRVFCSNDLPDGPLALGSNSVSELNYRYVLVDNAFNINRIIVADSLDPATLNPGSYWLVGISYGGNFPFRVGDNMFVPPGTGSLSCYGFSSNVIGITLHESTAGEISFDDGSFEWRLCPSGGNPVVGFSVPTFSGQQFYFLLVDENGILLDTTTENSYDFAGSGGGNIFIRGLSVTGDIAVEIGMPVDSQVLSTLCYSWSPNTLAIIFETPEGGEVFDDNWMDVVEVEVGPGMPDTVRFVNTSATPSNYVYILTTTEGTILRIYEKDYIVFNSAFFDELHVFGLAYTGSLTLVEGLSKAYDIASDDCYEWSDNFVTILLSDVNSADQGTHTSLTQSADLEFEWLGPNPVRNELNFRISIEISDKSPVFYRIFDRTGRHFHGGNLTPGLEEAHTIELNGLQPGFYFLSIVSGDGIETVGFIVE